jgi:hypothetical protein
MPNNPTRITVNKAQLPLVNRCLTASSVPTISALFSHFLTLYGEDYIGRYGSNRDVDSKSAIGREGMTETLIVPNEPLKVSKPTQNSQNSPFVEIIED